MSRRPCLMVRSLEDSLAHDSTPISSRMRASPSDTCDFAVPTDTPTAAAMRS